MNITRRTLFKSGALAAAMTAAGPLNGLVARSSRANTGTNNDAGYGPLFPAVDKTTGEVLLHLPDGFEYRSFGRTGEIMTDGIATPVRHDGMAAFPGPAGRIRLVRNHESVVNIGAIDPSAAYDPIPSGGTTTLEVNSRGVLKGSWVSASGTTFNCSGGPMPWGSWVTCEESVSGPGLLDIFFPGNSYTQPHGYIYEVPSGTGPGENAVPVPIKDAGRFTHEGVALDPATGILYETQDNFVSPSGLFRYLPAPGTNPMADGHLSHGGRLQMLAVADGGVPVPTDLSTSHPVGASYETTWVDIADPDPPLTSSDVPGTLAAFAAVSGQGHAQGAAVFSRLEGIFHSNGVIYFNSTQGGEGRPPDITFGNGYGQTWAYDTATGLLTLLFQSPGPDVLDLPDNLTVTPNEGLLLCEDGDVDNYLRGLTSDGEIFDFALNTVAGAEDDEFAGPTFSPDGHTLFVNIQLSSGLGAGITFAIWGPWARGPL